MVGVVGGAAKVRGPAGEGNAQCITYMDTGRKRNLEEERGDTEKQRNRGIEECDGVSVGPTAQLE